MNTQKFYAENGYAIVDLSDIRSIIQELGKIFTETREQFDSDYLRNRNLIKRFGDRPLVSTVFSHPDLVKTIQQICVIKDPTFCGPVVTHYTSTDKTGNSYGIAYHQDYPSMGSSKKSVIIWVALTDCGIDRHGISLIPKLHLDGLLNGEQAENGYHLRLNQEQLKQELTPHIEAGQVLLMSAFTPHKTYINPNFKHWKLSLSRRIDDLSDPDWAKVKYANAYGISVDRQLYLKSV